MQPFLYHNSSFIYRKLPFTYGDIDPFLKTMFTLTSAEVVSVINLFVDVGDEMKNNI